VSANRPEPTNVVSTTHTVVEVTLVPPGASNPTPTQPPLTFAGASPSAAGTASPRPPDEDWRAGLTRWAWGYHDALRRHPWALQVPISGPAVTPNLTAWLDDGLRSLAGTGLPEAEKLSVMLLLSGSVRNEATLAASIGAAGGDIMPTWGRLLARLTDPEDFPALHAALGSEAFAQDDEPDDEFVFGLDRVLDGIAALVSGKD
jgi:hypothetical protein